MNRTAPSRSSVKIWILVWISLVSVIEGLLVGYLALGPLALPVSGVGALTISLLMFAWYRHDALECGYRRSRVLDSAQIAVAVVALPYYLIRSRGLRRGLLVSGGLVLFSFACLVLYSGAALVGLQQSAAPADEVTQFPDNGSGALSYRRTIAPHYPIEMITQGLVGTAEVAVRVGADGKPTTVSLQHGTGHPQLDDEALRVVAQWEFYPRIVDGEPVEAEAVVPIVFELD